MMLLAAYTATGLLVYAASILWALLQGRDPNPAGALFQGILAGSAMVLALIITA